jgi:azurin
MNLKNVMLALIAVTLFACNQGGETKTEQKQETTTAPETTAPETQEAEAKEVELTLNANDQMQYDKKEFKVKAGQKIKFTLNHTGKMDKKSMGHNFVLLKAGIDPAVFAKAAEKATEEDHIPKAEAQNIIAHTKMLGGGESDTIEFEAPEAGVYNFMCTFPAHWGVMQGKFIVE